MYSVHPAYDCLFSLWHTDFWRESSHVWWWDLKIELFQCLQSEMMCCLYLCDIKQSWTQSVFWIILPPWLILTVTDFNGTYSLTNWPCKWMSRVRGSSRVTGLGDVWGSSKHLSLTVLQHWEQAWSHHPKWTQRICSEVFWTTRK